MSKNQKQGADNKQSNTSQTTENEGFVNPIIYLHDNASHKMETAGGHEGRRKSVAPANEISDDTERYEASKEEGLSSEQVERRFNEGLYNCSRHKVGKTYGSIFVSNIFTFFNMLTFIVAAALIAAKATLSQLFFLLIIIANIIIGIIQEIRAKREVDKLKIVAAPTTKVIRDGIMRAISVEDIVLDDIMLLEMGKQVCADCIMLDGECEVNESMLTGESVSVRKHAGEKLYSGSYITSGKCYARVDKVGASNYMETLINNVKKYRKPRSVLQHSITLIMKVVTVFIIPISVIMLYTNLKSGVDLTTTIMKSSGAVIGMIPAGMFLLTSIALAVSVIRLSNRKVLVQDLYCIEMLARVDVLCIDKTGTITDGSMNVNKVVPYEGGDYVLPVGVDTVIGSMLVATGDNNQTSLALAKEFGYSGDLVSKAALPFSSQRKYSAVTFDEIGTFVLGAPEFVLTDSNREINQIIMENASEGYRVICLAHTDGMIEDGVVTGRTQPICFIVIEDHIRDDAIDTIKWFTENDVAIKIISGDNPITVSEVARRVGVPNSDLYISLEGLASQEVIEAASKYTVFGRVSPEQKCLLVRAMKAKGHTVAMTGDGVNDILAMREADCSVAIASGTEAARNVSHLVLTDSNFTNMPYVVMEGRRVVNNITKSASLFLMKTFMSIVLSMIFIFLGTPYPLQTNNLLLLEMFVIGLPSFMLALQSNNNRIKGDFLANVISRAIPGGMALIISVMAVFLYRQIIGAAGWLGAYSPEEVEVMFTSITVLALSFTGLIVLGKICEPFNAYRVFLFIITFALMVIAILLVGESLDIMQIKTTSQLDITNIFFVIIISLASYFIVSFVMKILFTLKIMTEA